MLSCPPVSVRWARGLVLLSALAVTCAVSAQPTVETGVVSGHVHDAEGRPLPGANVYLSGTTRGAAANAEGRFQIDAVRPGAYRVVASMLGFTAEVHDILVRPGGHETIAFRLQETTASLGDVHVEASADRRWQRRLAAFERALIGESAFAAETQILNPEVLDFRSRWGTLYATAAAPLVIVNRALGYRLTYDLHEFSAGPTRISYDGDERFEELAPDSPAQAVQWEAARAQAYRGSLRHLLRALLHDRLEEEGFSLTLVRTDPVAPAAMRSSFRATARRILRLDDEPGWGTLRVRDQLDIVFSGEPEEEAYLRSDWFRERRGRPDTVQRSGLRIRRGRARIDPQGTPEDPFAITTFGYMAFERLGDLLPAEYEPPLDA